LARNFQGAIPYSLFLSLFLFPFLKCSLSNDLCVATPKSFSLGTKLSSFLIPFFFFCFFFLFSNAQWATIHVWLHRSHGVLARNVQRMSPPFTISNSLSYLCLATPSTVVAMGNAPPKIIARWKSATRFFYFSVAITCV